MDNDDFTMRFTQTLKMLEGSYETEPVTQIYIKGLISRVEHRDLEAGNPGLTAETLALDTIQVLHHFERRLDALEKGEPAPR